VRTVPRVEFVDIVKDRQLVAQASMRDDQLEPAIRPRRRRGSTAQSPVGPCAHDETVQAFAYRRSRDEHWPVSFCASCLAVLAGRDPLVKAGKRPRWKYDERNLAAARWSREWPKAGRPRTRTPPARIAWPDAA
jgi:hypothetical protein